MDILDKVINLVDRLSQRKWLARATYVVCMSFLCWLVVQFILAVAFAKPNAW